MGDGEVGGGLGGGLCRWMDRKIESEGRIGMTMASFYSPPW